MEREVRGDYALEVIPVGLMKLALLVHTVGLGGRGIGRFFLFRALFRVLGPVWGTVALVVVLAGVGFGQQAIQRKRR
ncbi:MAG: hypothetical protein JWN32_3863 [Solirubrobacterales bacterium]|jgi:hypothetical protein|nr:hypothetical protein [Solirubrobacterales bacterium]